MGMRIKTMAAALGTALGALLVLPACSDRGGAGPASSAAAGFTAIDITGASYANKLELPDPDGRVRRLEDFKGKLVLVFFGYTQCPDVCPTTLAELAAVRKAMGPDGAKVQPVFVSVDPQRDTPEVLKAYMGNFDPSFLALIPENAEALAQAQDFKVFYAKVPGKTPDTYTIDHTAGTYVFDTQGRIRLFMRHGQAPAAIEADLKRLLASS